MSGRTKGSWERDDNCVYALESVPRKHGGSETRNRVVFWVQGGPATPREELIATAALAQAAPDLLDALRDILSDVEQGAIPNRDDDWWKRARAAIAKAEGSR